MINEKKKKTVADYDLEALTTAADDSECEAKIENLNKKLQETTDELEEISRLYAKSVKDGLDKAKKIKELEQKIEELEAELAKCKKAREKLEKQLENCKKDKQELEKKLESCKEEKEQLKEALKKCQENKGTGSNKTYCITFLSFNDKL